MVRKKLYPIDDIFIKRWSPRAMSGQPISDQELMALFEAARWAPSSYNNQPWRFFYAKKDGAYWKSFFDLMVPFNQSWTKNAAVLVIIASKKNFEFNNKPSITHGFDAGAAWMSLVLQGAMQGLVVHGMEGFDYAKALKVAGLSDEYEVHAMCAIGKSADKSVLPAELQEKEVLSDRKPLADIVFEGKLK